jgi:hypothetical protein
MPHFPGFDALLLIWGAAVLVFGAICHFYFGGTCIQIDSPPHLPFRTKRGS